MNKNLLKFALLALLLTVPSMAIAEAPQFRLPTNLGALPLGTPPAPNELDIGPLFQARPGAGGGIPFTAMGAGDVTLLGAPAGISIDLNASKVIVNPALRGIHDVILALGNLTRPFRVQVEALSIAPITSVSADKRSDIEVLPSVMGSFGDVAWSIVNRPANWPSTLSFDSDTGAITGKGGVKATIPGIQLRATDVDGAMETSLPFNLAFTGDSCNAQGISIRDGSSAPLYDETIRQFYETCTPIDNQCNDGSLRHPTWTRASCNMTPKSQYMNSIANRATQTLAKAKEIALRVKQFAPGSGCSADEWCSRPSELAYPSGVGALGSITFDGLTTTLRNFISAGITANPTVNVDLGGTHPRELCIELAARSNGLTHLAWGGAWLSSGALGNRSLATSECARLLTGTITLRY